MINPIKGFYLIQRHITCIYIILFTHISNISDKKNIVHNCPIYNTVTLVCMGNVPLPWVYLIKLWTVSYSLNKSKQLASSSLIKPNCLFWATRGVLLFDMTLQGILFCYAPLSVQEYSKTVWKSQWIIPGWSLVLALMPSGWSQQLIPP